MENELNTNRKIFTITVDKHWNTSMDLFEKEYRIVSEAREVTGGFEFDIEEV